MIYKGKKRKLIMSDGSEYVGIGFGEDTGNRVCELVFNTSPVGYQEIMSDPSYTDQFVTMAYPLMEITASMMTITKPSIPPSAVLS